MPTVADVEALAKALGSVSPGEPKTYEVLTVTPLLAPVQAGPEWVTMAEAGDRARITALSGTNLAGAALVAEGRVAHLMAFPI